MRHFFVTLIILGCCEVCSTFLDCFSELLLYLYCPSMLIVSSLIFSLDFLHWMLRTNVLLVLWIITAIIIDTWKRRLTFCLCIITCIGWAMVDEGCFVAFHQFWGQQMCRSKHLVYWWMVTYKHLICICLIVWSENLDSCLFVFSRVVSQVFFFIWDKPFLKCC
jgi:hypothetical protein